MSEPINATCSICGKGYHLCNACKSVMDLSPWKKHTDTSEHYKIYQIIRGYTIKVYDKEEAKQKLKNVDLSDLHELRENIQVIIKDIMHEDPVIMQEDDQMPKARSARKKRSVKNEEMFETNEV